MRQFTPYLFLLLAASFLYSCKSAKLSDAEEKQRIGEYFEAAAITGKYIRRLLLPSETCVDISLSGWQSVTV